MGHREREKNKFREPKTKTTNLLQSSLTKQLKRNALNHVIHVGLVPCMDKAKFEMKRSLSNAATGSLHYLLVCFSPYCKDLILLTSAQSSYVLLGNHNIQTIIIAQHSVQKDGLNWR
jgi:hypothetical protein